MQDKTIGINSTAQGRHNGRSRFSYYAPGWGALTKLVAERLVQKAYERGRMDGTFLVRFEPAEGFEGRGIERGAFESDWVRRHARFAQVVVWHRSALKHEATTDCEYEIVSVEAYS